MKKFIILYVVILFAGTACDMEYLPYDGLPESQLIASDVGLKGATIGNYNYLKDSYYQRNFHFFGEYGGDNVSLSGTTSDHLFYCYNYQHFPGMSPTQGFWEKTYQLVVGCNKVIQAIGDDASEEMKQVKGENLFIRAQTYFHLVNVFGRPYYQNPETSLGIPIKLDDDVENIPARATVKEVYEQVIADLVEAEKLMGSEKANIFASKEVAQALLSRVYLYMSGTPDSPVAEYATKSIEYANKVISSGRYSLMATGPYKGYFKPAPEDNVETIFAVKHQIDVDDRGWSSLGSMYNHVEGKGFGEMYASEPYRNLLDEFPEDARHAFVEPQYNDDGSLQERNGYPKYYINKYSMQEDEPTLSSPVFIRLAEMYLNRAEANAKLGNNGDAIDDVNEIRQRAGLSGDALYSVDDLKGRSSVFQVVLDERRLELAFEAQRRFDIFRNGLTLDRNYPGTHDGGASPLLEIPADHPRVIFYIPESQMNVQENLVQNP
ncbi:RagB/SusD family nutrient uptake outer membrane protein [Puteibacter caeruleilacunae]|nr:RagB/SusD family nutrient uptake outer membrane protein [Puteibacter caeruleilacunae]